MGDPRARTPIAAVRFRGRVARATLHTLSRYYKRTMPKKLSISKPVLAVIALILVGLAGFWVYRWYATQKRQDRLLQSVEQLDFSGIESQVVQKIQRLAREVRGNRRSDIAWGKLAMNLDVHDFKDESIPLYMEASNLNGSNFRWSYFCAMVMLQNGDRRATEWFGRASHNNPGYAPLYVHWGDALVRSGQIEEAKQHYRQAAELDPNNSHAHLALAQLAFANKDLENAKAHLTKSIEANPIHTEAYELLITVCKQQKDTPCMEKARAFASRMPEKTSLADPIQAELTLEGESSRWYRFRGSEFLKQGMQDRAIAEFRRALEIRPDAGTKEDLAKSLSAAGRHSEALDMYQSVLKERPTAENYFSIALAHAKKGSYSEAESFFRKAVELKPDFAEAYFNLAVLFAKRGKLAETIQNLKESVRINPRYAEAHYHLGLAHIAAQDRKAALQEHAALTQLNPKLAEQLRTSIESGIRSASTE